VLCDIYQNTIFNFQVLLYCCIIKLQSCHLLLSFPEFVIILLLTVNFSPMTKTHITAQHNSSYTNLWGLSFMYTLIWCPTYVAQICSSVAGLSHCGFDKLFIQTIHCRPHFVKRVIIRAVRIGLFLMLKCRQIWIFSNIFLRQYRSPVLCPTHQSRDHEHWGEGSKNH